MEIEVIAMVYGPGVDSIRERPMDFQCRETKSGVAVSLPCIGDRKFVLHPDLSRAELRVNVNEGKANGFATVVCGTSGEKIRPFWVKSKRNQRNPDKNVDARFSFSRPFCLVTLGSDCLLNILEINLVRHKNFIEVVQKTIFCYVPKRLSGKFIFSENLLKEHSQFNDSVKAVIKKANSSDGGGPTFFQEEYPMEVYRRNSPKDLIPDANGRYRFSGGVAMPLGEIAARSG